MSDETKTQEQDAATIAKYREWLPEYEAGLEDDWTPETDERMGELFEFIDEGASEIIGAALRTIDRQQAEIERLTTAQATAEAERDAAVRALELAVESGDVLMFGRAGNTMTSLGLQPGHGYFVSYQGDLPDLHPSFRDAWDIFHRHAKDHPIIIAPNNTQQPAAAPAVDAAPVGERGTVFHLRKARDIIYDGRSMAELSRIEIAMLNIIIAVEIQGSQQKGETQS